MVPYVQNRVKLSHPIEESDYINASWITNENRTDIFGNQTCTFFIASQGPMLHTCPQHLQMIYRNQVDIILTLTKSDDNETTGG